MTNKNVLRSFRINAQLWKKFTNYCAENETTATAAITRFIESTVMKPLPDKDDNKYNDNCIDIIYTKYIKDIEVRLSLVESKICNDVCNDGSNDVSNNYNKICNDVCNDNGNTDCNDGGIYSSKNTNKNETTEHSNDDLPNSCNDDLPDSLLEGFEENNNSNCLSGLSDNSININTENNLIETNKIPDRQNEEQKEIKELNYKDSYLRIKELLNEGKTKTTIHKDLQIKSIYPNYSNKLTKNEINFKWNKNSLKTFIKRYESENSISENDSILKYF